MKVIGGHRTKRASRIGVLVLLIMNMFCGVQAKHSYSSTECEALRVLSKHKALFTLIPQRVAQILKLVRLHSHAAPVQRLDIVQGAIRHVHGKYRIVNQLRDTARQTRGELDGHLRKAVINQFTSLEKRLSNYIQTLRATLNVLDTEVEKLLALPGTASLKAKSSKAHKAAQAVLAPNHIDTLVDTLAGHDRAVDADPARPLAEANQAMKGEIEELRKDLANVADSVEETIETVTQDFAGVMATMSKMHSQAALEREDEMIEQSSVPSEPAQSAAPVVVVNTPAPVVHVAQPVAEKKKEEAPCSHSADVPPTVEEEIKHELVGDLRTLGGSALRVYRRVKNGVVRVSRGAYDAVVRVLQGAQKSAARLVGTAQPMLMTQPLIGGHAASAGTWTMAGSLGAASRMDPTRIVEQPLIPHGFKQQYDDAVVASRKTITDIATSAGAGIRNVIGSIDGFATRGAAAVVETARSGVDGVANVAQNGVSGVQSGFTGLMGWLRSELEGLADFSARLMSGAAALFDTVAAQTVTLARGTWGLITDLTDGIVGFFSRGAATVKNMGGHTVGVLGTGLNAARNAVGGVGHSGVKGVSVAGQLTKDGATALGSYATRGIQSVGDYAGRGVQAVGTLAQNAGTTTTDFVRGVGGSAIEGVSAAGRLTKNGVTAIGSYATRGVQSVSAAGFTFGQAVRSYVHAASDIVSSALTGIQTMISNLWQWLQGSSHAVSDVVVGSTRVVGAQLAGLKDTVTNGVRRGIETGASSASNLLDTATTSARNAGSLVCEYGSCALERTANVGRSAVHGVQGAADAAVAHCKNAVGSVQGVAQQATRMVGNTVHALARTAEHMSTGALAAGRNAVNWFASTGGDFAHDLQQKFNDGARRAAHTATDWWQRGTDLATRSFSGIRDGVLELIGKKKAPITSVPS